MARYDVGDHLPVDALDPGTNLLVAGPPLTGKRQLALSLQADGCERGEGAVVVGTQDSVESIKKRVPAVWAAVSAGDGGIVDCTTRQSGGMVQDEALVKYVASPGDVTDVGIRLGGVFQHLETECERVRVNVSTISAMLMYADNRRIYRFLHVFTSHIDRLGWLGLGVLDTSNREAFNSLAPLYDGMLQTRTTGDGTEFRLVGLGQGRTDWVAY